MFQKLTERVARFMNGRYGGYDRLNRFLLVIYILLLVVQFFAGTRTVASTVLLVLSAIVAGFYLFRSFSKNLPARAAENEKYERIRGRIVRFFRLQKDRFRDRKTHVYRKCPKCGAVLRLSRRGGTHTAVCPRCGNRFQVKS